MIVPRLHHHFLLARTEADIIIISYNNNQPRRQRKNQQMIKNVPVHEHPTASSSTILSLCGPFSEVVELVPLLSQSVALFWSVVVEKGVPSGCGPTAFISGQSPRGICDTGEIGSWGSIISARNATGRRSATLGLLMTSYGAAQHWGPVLPRQCSIAFAINSSGHPVVKKRVIGDYVSSNNNSNIKNDTKSQCTSQPKTDNGDDDPARTSRHVPEIKSA
jgi:hypothetical protein